MLVGAATLSSLAESARRAAKYDSFGATAGCSPLGDLGRPEALDLALDPESGFELLDLEVAVLAISYTEGYL